MGLASALSTALTGLSAAETTIDVVGNNLANSNTVGFKSSEATFASQFLQTMGLGSSPTDSSGGTNPRQTGLGTMVAEIAPNFNQGTIEISSNPLDMAIQGDGFYIVQGASGENLYTRNGIFKLNSENQITTITGNRVMGYGINDDFKIQRTQLVPLEIKLGGAEVAQATQNVYLEGTLTSQGDIADTAEIIKSGVLGDSRFTRPTAPGALPVRATAPATAGIGEASTAGGAMVPGQYYYKVVFCNSTAADPVWYPDTESEASDPFLGEVDPGDGSVTLSAIPTNANYHSRRIYRTTIGAASTDPYYLVGEIDNATPNFVDTTADAGLPATAMDETTIDGAYKYYVTYEDASGRESRPSPIIEPDPVENGRIVLRDLPAEPGGTWIKRHIYRNTADHQTDFYRIATIDDAITPGVNFTDNVSNTTAETGQQLDFNGPKITTGTPLVNVIQLGENFSSYTDMFEPGTLDFTGNKGGRDLATKEMDITATTTVGQLIEFMEQSMGIQTPPGPDLDHPIPVDEPTSKTPGGVVEAGQIVFVANNGMDNALEILSGALQLTTGTPPDTDTQSRDLKFGSAQAAVGNSAVTDLIAYDSLGMDIRIRITAVMESQSSTETVYRWFADSPDNQPVEGEDISIGTGLIYFDSEGNFDRSTNDIVSIYRRDVPSNSPLVINLDFNDLSGLRADQASLAVSRQDGSAPGTLTSFIVGDDGVIRGVFSNGITRNLGQIRMARFTNPAGLEQKGENLYAASVNSGLAIEGDPGSQGIGTIVAGATELSNTDIGGNLIDLILASTMYRGNTRVITTSQEMLEELLALRR